MKEAAQSPICSTKVMLSSNFRCDQVSTCQIDDFCHTWLCHLSLTSISNKLTSQADLFNKRSCLAPTFAVTQFTHAREGLVVELKSDFDIQQTYLALYKKVHAQLKF